MPHIDRGYHSVRENFRQIWVTKNRRRDRWKRANPFVMRSYFLPLARHDLDTFSIGTQFKGAFQPIVDAVYDAADTFRPNKSWRDVGWDLLQPIRGIGNILEALGQIVYIPLFIVAKLTIMNISVAITAKRGHKLESVFGNTVAAYVVPASWLLNSATKLLRGITQVITTPLSWIKMIVRGFSTLENRGVQRLVDDRSIVRLVAEGEALQRTIDREKMPVGGLVEDSDGLLTSQPQQPLVEKSENEKKLTAINTALEMKFKKAYNRSTGEKIARMKERENDGAIQNNEHTPKRLAFVGTSKPSDGNYVKFFKDASVARKTELQQISAKRFGRAAKAA